jgi:hypothetical protein
MKQIAAARASVASAASVASLALAASLAHGIAHARCVAAVATESGGAVPEAGGEGRRPELLLAAPGEYCLSGDLRQRKLADPRTGIEMKTIGGDAIVLVAADDVSLDLAGHGISNERELGYTLVRHYRYQPGRGHDHSFARTRIHSGSLNSPGSRGVAIRLVPARPRRAVEFGVPAPVPAGKTAADVHADTGHRLENLVIAAGSRAIVIEGMNNVIRNNRIAVDSATAIVAQGPGVVIENNLIEVRADLRAWSDYDRSTEARTPFPIRLIQADGAVVRNNEIRLVDVAGQAPLPAAIQLVASRDVTVAGNRMHGMQVTVTADGASSHREAGNRLETCPSGEARFPPPEQGGDPAPSHAPVCRRNAAGG